VPIDDEADRRIVLSNPIPEKLIRDLGRVPLVTHAIDYRSSEQRRLTPALWETLKLLAAGYTTSQIAEASDCSFEAAADRVRRVLARFDTRSRMEVVVRCYREGII
jgi:DNA-binding NarL/FixJ family response regulator